MAASTGPVLERWKPVRRLNGARGVKFAAALTANRTSAGARFCSRKVSTRSRECASPDFAAMAYHLSAWVRSCVTPMPRSYRTPHIKGGIDITALRSAGEPFHRLGLVLRGTVPLDIGDGQIVHCLEIAARRRRRKKLEGANGVGLHALALPIQGAQQILAPWARRPARAAALQRAAEDGSPLTPAPRR